MLGKNPGGDDGPFSLRAEDLTAVFQTNLIGPACVAQAFVSLVEKSARKTVVNVSSTLGSIGSVHTFDHERFTSYAIVKAGLNMLVRFDISAAASGPIVCQWAMRCTVYPFELTASTRAQCRLASRRRNARISPRLPSALDTSRRVRRLDL